MGLQSRITTRGPVHPLILAGHSITTLYSSSFQPKDVLPKQAVGDILRCPTGETPCRARVFIDVRSAFSVRKLYCCIASRQWQSEFYG
jgi:hypothetical protein